MDLVRYLLHEYLLDADIKWHACSILFLNIVRCIVPALMGRTGMIKFSPVITIVASRVLREVKTIRQAL